MSNKDELSLIVDIIGLIPAIYGILLIIFMEKIETGKKIRSFVITIEKSNYQALPKFICEKALKLFVHVFGDNKISILNRGLVTLTVSFLYTGFMVEVSNMIIQFSLITLFRVIVQFLLIFLVFILGCKKLTKILAAIWGGIILFLITGVFLNGLFSNIYNIFYEHVEYDYSELVTICVLTGVTNYFFDLVSILVTIFLIKNIIKKYSTLKSTLLITADIVFAFFLFLLTCELYIFTVLSFNSYIATKSFDPQIFFSLNLMYMDSEITYLGIFYGLTTFIPTFLYLIFLLLSCYIKIFLRTFYNAAINLILDDIPKVLKRNEFTNFLKTTDNEVDRKFLKDSYRAGFLSLKYKLQKEVIEDTIKINELKKIFIKSEHSNKLIRESKVFTRIMGLVSIIISIIIILIVKLN